MKDETGLILSLLCYDVRLEKTIKEIIYIFDEAGIEVLCHLPLAELPRCLKGK